MTSRTYDVIVAGGGTAGIAAAAEAAAAGARTLLVEKGSWLGGTMVTGVPVLGMFDGRGVPAAQGFAETFVQRLVREGGAVGPVRGARWSNRGHMAGDEFVLTPFDSEIAKYVAQELVLEAGAEILLHTVITGVKMKDRRVEALELFGKGGASTAEADIFVDATGDADVCSWAGARMLPKERVQNSSILFVLGGVDTAGLLEALRTGDHVRGWGEWHSRVVSGAKIDSDRLSAVHIAGHFLPWDDSDEEVTFTAVSVREHEVYLNATRTVNVDGCDSESLTRGEISERRNIRRLVEGLRRNVPGFAKAYISRTAPIGIRESRTVIGDYILTADDVLQGRDFPDTVARGAYPSDIHDPRGGRTRFQFIEGGGSYGIPYRCLLPEGIEGLLAAGRAVSASQAAGGSVRLQATVMAIGQAAGAAAALAWREGTVPRRISAEELRRVLVGRGAVV